MDETARWRDPAWLAYAYEWIDVRIAELGHERTGPVEQSRVSLWATVLRIPTAGGVVWFKATADALRHEIAIVERIAARRPDAGPGVLATNHRAGWMLMADAGEPLRDVVARERSLSRWYDVLPFYAGVQRDLAADVDDLLAAGVPDRRLSTLPAAYERLIDELGAEPRFRAAESMVADLSMQLAERNLGAMRRLRSRRPRRGRPDRDPPRLGVPGDQRTPPGDEERTLTRLRMFLDGRP